MDKKLFWIVPIIVSTITTSFFAGVLGSFIYDNYLERVQANESQDTSYKEQVVFEGNSWVPIVEKTENAVVSVVVSQEVSRFDVFGFPFGRGRANFDDLESRQVGAGTGFFVNTDGYLVTNRHVVDNREADYTIVTNDGVRIPAKVVDMDNLLDIAILKVDPDEYRKNVGKSITYLKTGDSSTIKVGQGVIAIGNSLGEFSNTVSSGIVSGLSRSIMASSGMGSVDSLNNVIQTDASINPGNSGGPLLDSKGYVIGVNVAVAQNAENIGFSIPINEVQRVLDSVYEHGRIVRPFIGVRYIPLEEIPVRERVNLGVDYGVYLVGGFGEPAIVPGSPAEVAGLEEGDVIISINGRDILESRIIQEELKNFSVGDTIRVGIYRDGKKLELDVVLAEAV